MERLEIEKFKACLAMAGIKEAILPGRIYYLVGNTLPAAAAGRDERGPYLDFGPVRARPSYTQKSANFTSQEEVEAFIQRTIAIKEV